MKLSVALISVLSITTVAAALAADSSPQKTQQRGVPSSAAHRAAVVRPVTQHDIDAVLLAIQDEIYAGGCAPEFADIGKEVSGGERTNQINVFFDRSFHDGYSWVIYKFWPFGEVNRMYWVDKEGLAHLAGHPDWDFPPTEPSYLTVYMGDRELIHLKSTWERVPLDIQLSPSAQRIHQAEQRQLERGGNVGVCQGKWYGNFFVPQNH